MSETGAGIARCGSVLGSLSCLVQCHGFDPPLGRIFPVEGSFFLGVNIGFNSIP